MNICTIISLWIFITNTGTLVSGFGAKEEKIHSIPFGDFWNEVISGSSPQLESTSRRDKLSLESIEDNETLKNGLDWSLKSYPNEEGSYEYEDDPTRDDEQSNSVEDDYEDNKLATDDYSYYDDETERTPSSPRSNTREGKQEDIDMFHNWRLEGSIPGIPEADYPVYVTVPQTEFSCDKHPDPGFYGDVDARCQVFHICQEDGRHHSFLCPVGTVFNQKHFVCDWWFRFNCTDTPKYYQLNSLLYKVSEKENQYKRKHADFHRSVKTQMDKMKHLMNTGGIGAPRGRRTFRSNTPETITETQKEYKAGKVNQKGSIFPPDQSSHHDNQQRINLPTWINLPPMTTSNERQYGKGHVIVIRRPHAFNRKFKSEKADRTSLPTLYPTSVTTLQTNSSYLLPVENEDPTTSLADGYTNQESTQGTDTLNFMYHVATQQEHPNDAGKSQLHLDIEPYTQNNSEKSITLYSESRHDLTVLPTEAVSLQQMNETDFSERVSEINTEKSFSTTSPQDSTETLHNVINESEISLTTNTFQSSSTEEGSMGTSMEIVEDMGENLTESPAFYTGTETKFSGTHLSRKVPPDFPLEITHDSAVIRQNRRNLNGKVRRQRIRMAPKFNNTLKRKMIRKKRPEWKRVSLFRTKTMRKPETRLMYPEMFPRTLQEVKVRRNYWNSLRRNGGIRNVSWILPRKKMLRRRMDIGEMKVLDSAMAHPDQLGMIPMGKPSNDTMSYFQDLQEMFFMRLNDNNKLNSTEIDNLHMRERISSNIPFPEELPKSSTTIEEMFNDYNEKKPDDRIARVMNDEQDHNPDSENLDNPEMLTFKDGSKLMAVEEEEKAVRSMDEEDKYQGPKCDLICVQVLHNLLKTTMNRENETDSLILQNKNEMDIYQKNYDNSSSHISPVDFTDSDETNCNGTQGIMVGSINGFSVIIDSGSITREKTVKVRRCKPESIGSEDILASLTTDHRESSLSEKQAFKISNNEPNLDHHNERNMYDEFTAKPDNYRATLSYESANSFPLINNRGPRINHPIPGDQTATKDKGDRSNTVQNARLIEQILSVISLRSFSSPRDENLSRKYVNNLNDSFSEGIPLAYSMKEDKSSAYLGEILPEMSFDRNNGTLILPLRVEDGNYQNNASAFSYINHHRTGDRFRFKNTQPGASLDTKLLFFSTDNRKDGLSHEMLSPRASQEVDAHSANRQLSENDAQITRPLPSHQNSRELSSFMKEIISKLNFDEKVESLKIPSHGNTMRPRYSMPNLNSSPLRSSRVTYISEKEVWNKDLESRKDTSRDLKPNQNSATGDTPKSRISDTDKVKVNRSPDLVPEEQNWMLDPTNPHPSKTSKDAKNSHKDFISEEWAADSRFKDNRFFDSRDLSRDWSNPKAFKQSWTSGSKNTKDGWKSDSRIPPGDGASSDFPITKQGWTTEQKQLKDDWAFENKNSKSGWNVGSARSRSRGSPDSPISRQSWSSSSANPKRDWSSSTGRDAQSWHPDSERPKKDLSLDTKSSRRQWTSVSKDVKSDWSSSYKKPAQDWRADNADDKYDWWSDPASVKQDWLMDSVKSKDDWFSDISASKEDWSSDASKSNQNWSLDAGKSKQEWASDSHKNWDSKPSKEDWPTSSTNSKQNRPSQSTRVQRDWTSDSDSQGGQHDWPSDSKLPGRDWASASSDQQDWQSRSRKKKQNVTPDSRNYKKDWSSTAKSGQSDWARDSKESKVDRTAGSWDSVQDWTSGGGAQKPDRSLDSQMSKRDWSSNSGTDRRDWSTYMQPGIKDSSSDSKSDKNNWFSDTRDDRDWSSDLQDDRLDWSNMQTSKDDWSLGPQPDEKSRPSDSRANRGWSSDAQANKNSWSSDLRGSRDWSSGAQADKNAWSSDSQTNRDWSSNSQMDKRDWGPDLKAGKRDWSTDVQTNSKDWSSDYQSDKRDWPTDPATAKGDWSSDSQSDKKNWPADSGTSKGSWSSGSRNFEKGRAFGTDRSEDKTDNAKQDWSSRSKDSRKDRMFDAGVSSQQKPSSSENPRSDSFPGTSGFKRDWPSPMDSSHGIFRDTKKFRQDWSSDTKTFTQKTRPSPPKDWSRDSVKGSQTWKPDSKTKTSKNMPTDPKGKMQGRRFDPSENSPPQWSFDSKTDSKDWPPSRRGDQDWQSFPDKRGKDWAPDTAPGKAWRSESRSPTKDWTSDSSDSQRSWSSDSSSKGKHQPLPSWNAKPDVRPGSWARDQSEWSSPDEDKDIWDSKGSKKDEEMQSPKPHTTRTGVKGSDSRPPKDKIPNGDWKRSTARNSNRNTWGPPDSHTDSGSDARTSLKGGQSWNDEKGSEKGVRGAGRVMPKGAADSRPSWSSATGDVKNIRWSIPIGEDGKLANGWVPITGKPRQRSNSSFPDTSMKNSSGPSDGRDTVIAMKAWGPPGMNLMNNEEESSEEINSDRPISSEESKKILRWIPSSSRKLSESYRSESRKVRRRESGEGTGEWSARFEFGNTPSSGWVPILNIKSYLKNKINDSVDLSFEDEHLKEISENTNHKTDEKVELKSEDVDHHEKIFIVPEPLDKRLVFTSTVSVVKPSKMEVPPENSANVNNSRDYAKVSEEQSRKETLTISHPEDTLLTLSSMTSNTSLADSNDKRFPYEEDSSASSRSLENNIKIIPFSSIHPHLDAISKARSSIQEENSNSSMSVPFGTDIWSGRPYILRPPNTSKITINRTTPEILIANNDQEVPLQNSGIQVDSYSEPPSGTVRFSNKREAETQTRIEQTNTKLNDIKQMISFSISDGRFFPRGKVFSEPNEKMEANDEEENAEVLELEVSDASGLLKSKVELPRNQGSAEERSHTTNAQNITKEILINGKFDKSKSLGITQFLSTHNEEIQENREEKAIRNRHDYEKSDERLLSVSGEEMENKIVEYKTPNSLKESEQNRKPVKLPVRKGDIFNSKISSTKYSAGINSPTSIFANIKNFTDVNSKVQYQIMPKKHFESININISP